MALLLGGELAGTLTQDPQTGSGTTTSCAARADATPLSTSMPLSVDTYRQARTLPWIDGLLPDNQQVRDRWAQQFGVPAGNPFAVLAHMGKDCPGAVQICPLDQVLAVAEQRGELIPLTDSEIASRLGGLRRDASSWNVPGERWSLGGAQSKFALSLVQGRWCEATGASATTHILKPGVDSFRSHGLNEHLTMQASHDLGIRVAATEYREFDGEPAVIVSRYDRLTTGAGVIRVHQEDTCQALGVARGKKYEEQGGPGAAQIVDLLQAVATPQDVWRFVESLAFNYLSGASDGHAKNYSLLLAGAQTRLAPLYDLSSSLPYDPTGADPGLRSLAIAIGGQRRAGSHPPTSTAWPGGPTSQPNACESELGRSPPTSRMPCTLPSAQPGQATPSSALGTSTDSCNTYANADTTPLQPPSRARHPTPTTQSTAALEPRRPPGRRGDHFRVPMKATRTACHSG